MDLRYSVCQVNVNNVGRKWLKRLADVTNGTIVGIDDNHPYINWNNGPNRDGILGIWMWDANNPTYSKYMTDMTLFNIKIIPKTASIKEIVKKLLTGVKAEIFCDQTLFCVQNNNLCILCKRSDFAVSEGKIFFKKGNHHLFVYRINKEKTISLNNKIFYNSYNLPDSDAELRINITEETGNQRVPRVSVEIISDHISEREPEKVSFITSNNRLDIIDGQVLCLTNGHRIIPAIGIFDSLSGKQYEINIHYCTECKKYYTYRSTFLRYQEKFGPLFGNINILQNQNNKNELEDESRLRICGYTVNQDDDFSDNDRHRIMENIMKRKILTKFQIINYLTWFIKSKEHRQDMYNAISKWESDLNWLQKHK